MFHHSCHSTKGEDLGTWSKTEVRIASFVILQYSEISVNEFHHKKSFLRLCFHLTKLRCEHVDDIVVILDIQLHYDKNYYEYELYCKMKNKFCFDDNNASNFLKLCLLVF